MGLIIRDHRPAPLRPRWTSANVRYYDVTSDSHAAPLQSRHHAAGGMSLAEIDAWLTRGELARGRRDTVRKVTYAWRQLPGPGPRRFRAVVCYWGRWDVARSWHIDAGHPRELFEELIHRGVFKVDAADEGAYLAWLLLGRR